MAIYFASDVHLGLTFGSEPPAVREQRFVAWLRQIEARGDCQELYLVGDIFDFFYEWRHVVPKGYVRTLGQLASMADRGTHITFFPGNHDLWVTDYFSQELGVHIAFEPLTIERQGKKLFIAHGDTFYRHQLIGRCIEAVLRRRSVYKAVSSLLPPAWMVRFGHSWSHSNRAKRGSMVHTFGAEQDFLVRFARQYLAQQDPSIDCFVFGHEHTPVAYDLGADKKLYILGQWVGQTPVVGRMEGGVIELVDA